MDSRRALTQQQLDLLFLLLGALLLIDLTAPSMLGGGGELAGREIDEGWMSVVVVPADPGAAAFQCAREIELIVLDDQGTEIASNREASSASSASGVVVQFDHGGGQKASFRVRRPTSSGALRLRARVTTLEPTLMRDAGYMLNASQPTRLVVYPTVESLAVDDEIEAGSVASSRPVIELQSKTGMIGDVELPLLIPGSN